RFVGWVMLQEHLRSLQPTSYAVHTLPEQEVAVAVHLDGVLDTAVFVIPLRVILRDVRNHVGYLELAKAYLLHLLLQLVQPDHHAKVRKALLRRKRFYLRLGGFERLILRLVGLEVPYHRRSRSILCHVYPTSFPSDCKVPGGFRSSTSCCTIFLSEATSSASIRFCWTI